MIVQVVGGGEGTSRGGLQVGWDRVREGGKDGRTGGHVQSVSQPVKEDATAVCRTARTVTVPPSSPAHDSTRLDSLTFVLAAMSLSVVL